MSNFRLSKRADYALSLMSLLAKKKKGKKVSLQQMGKKGMPKAFMAQIANDLVKADVLDSQEGRGGGYSLKREPGEIRIGEVLEAVEGEVAPVDCENCSAEGECCQKKFMDRLTGEIKEMLDSYTLIDLVDN